MSDQQPARPLAIRIMRPYESESELLAAEASTLTRGTVLLLGARPRPEGTILRFELVLRTGTPILRGEGKVTGYQDETSFGQPGLVVKVARLDAKSKRFLDDLLGPPSGLAPASMAPESYHPPSLAPAVVAAPEAVPTTPGSVDVNELRAARPSDPVTRNYQLISEPPPNPDSGIIDTNKAGALARLRERGKSLSDDAVRSILRKS